MSVGEGTDPAYPCCDAMETGTAADYIHVHPVTDDTGDTQVTMTLVETQEAAGERYLAEWETGIQQEEFVDRAYADGLLADEQLLTLKTYEDVYEDLPARQGTYETVIQTTSFRWPNDIATLRIGDDTDPYQIRWTDTGETNTLRIIAHDPDPEQFTDAYRTFAETESLTEDIKQYMEAHR